MRLWSLSLKYLDQRGLCGLWTESLLAQKVLMGQTEAYKNHPQLIRWRRDNSDYLISRYLWSTWHEGEGRGYHFIWQKIWKHERSLPDWVTQEPCLTVTKGQVVYEAGHLLNKLKIRDKKKFLELKQLFGWREGSNYLYYNEEKIEVNPIFEIVEGGVEGWERIKN